MIRRISDEGFDSTHINQSVGSETRTESIISMSFLLDNRQHQLDRYKDICFEIKARLTDNAAL